VRLTQPQTLSVKTLQAAEVKPKAVCICDYTARKDRYGQTYLVRKTEPKCQQHGSRATEE
jgi:hypothetical protein